MSGHHDIGAIRARLAAGDGPAFWRSLDAVADTPEFRSYLEAEFPSAARLAASPERCGFLKLMAASFALAGLSACGSGDGRHYALPCVKASERIVAAPPSATPPRRCSTASPTASSSRPSTVAP